MKHVPLSGPERELITQYLCGSKTLVDRSYEPFLDPNNEIAEDLRETSQNYALCCLAIDEAIDRLHEQNPDCRFSKIHDLEEIFLRMPHIAAFFSKRERLKNERILLEQRYIMHEMMRVGVETAATIPGSQMISTYGISHPMGSYEWYAGRSDRRLLVHNTRRKAIFDEHTKESPRATVFLPNGEPRVVEKEVAGTLLRFWSFCENTLRTSRDSFSRTRN